MNLNNLHKKIGQLLSFVSKELDKPLSRHNYEIHMWEKGYRSAMLSVKSFVENMFSKDS